MIRATGYDVAAYGEMIDCEPRMGVYVEALRRAVTPGCTVIDLGAGFGGFALLACKFGAGRVIAIEPNPCIDILMPLARANGCADRITVVQDLSINYSPERKADVVVSDCRGIVPLFEHHVATIKDARDRLLASGGTLMPMRDTLRVALVHSPKTYRGRHYPWLSNNYGLDLSAAQHLVANTQSKVTLDRETLISEPCDLAVIDYRTITNPTLDATVELSATSAKIAHGLLVWFDAEIADGLKYSNAPGQPPLVYGQMFLPFVDPPLLEVGDRVSARIRGNLIENQYVWSWDSRIIDGQSGETRANFRQSTFLGRVVSKQAADVGSNLAVPQRSQRMELDADCLAMIDGGTKQDEIANAMMARYPDFLPDYRRALDHVVALLLRYKEN